MEAELTVQLADRALSVVGQDLSVVPPWLQQVRAFRPRRICSVAACADPHAHLRRSMALSLLAWISATTASCKRMASGLWG